MIGRRFTHRDLNIEGIIVGVHKNGMAEVKYDSLKYVRFELVSKLRLHRETKNVL
jgi:hypothetical protein